MRSPVADLLDDLRRALEAASTRWYLFGAQAALLYGAARLTADVDVTIDWPHGSAPGPLVDALAAHGFVLRVTDPVFVARTRVLPLAHAPTSLPLDAVLAGPGLEDAFFARVVEHDDDATTDGGYPLPPRQLHGGHGFARAKAALSLRS